MDDVEAWYDKQRDCEPNPNRLALDADGSWTVTATYTARAVDPVDCPLRTHLHPCVSSLCHDEGTKNELTTRIHPKVPVRLLLSVSSTALFLSSWTHVEPCLIDLTVIQAGRGRKRGAAVNAILKAGSCFRYRGLCSQSVWYRTTKRSHKHRRRAGRESKTSGRDDRWWGGLGPEDFEGEIRGTHATKLTGSGHCYTTV